MNTLLQDLRYGLRTLTKAPGFTAIAVATLALGIGANTAIFSVVRAVLLRSLPYPHPAELVVVHEHNDRSPGKMGIAWPNFLDWRNQVRSLRTPAGYRLTRWNVSGTREPELLRGAEISAPFFSLLAVRPALGRDFLETDDRPGVERTVILSDKTWRTRYGADPAIVGRAIPLDAVPYVVVGVLPAGFSFFPEPVDVFTPIGLNGAIPGWLERGNHMSMRALARLAPGASLDTARAELSGFMRDLEKAYPRTNAGQKAAIEPLTDALYGEFRAPLWILLAAVGLVLLIACVNVAHLLLARAASRQREFAIRLALGAGRGRLLRQLLTESLLLAFLGGALGVALAAWTMNPLVSLAPSEIPRLADTRIDPVVLFFTLAASMLTGVLFGLAPATQASRPDPQAALRETGPGATSSGSRQSLRRALFVSEVALAFVLAVASGLLIQSLLKVQRVPLGFEPDRVLSLTVLLPDKGYETDTARRQFFERSLEELRRLPGVESAGATLCTPLQGRCWGSVYQVSDRPTPAQTDIPSSAFNTADPDYFATIGIPLRAGRLFTQEDRDDSPKVVIINESMARRWWPNESPLGKRIKQGFPQDDRPFREIVGVVGDVAQVGLDLPVQTEVYLPMAQATDSAVTFLVRTGSEPMSLARAATAAIHRVDPNQSVTWIQPLTKTVAESVARRKFTTLLLGLFGALALALASVGIYGVVSYGVAQRTREIGIRTALGAQPGDVLRLVIAQALRLAAFGILAGIAGALVLTRFLQSLLFQTPPFDPSTFAGVAALLTAVVLAACAWPAKRALDVNPTIALRTE
jgi:putative ABC transport system permease protein